MALSKEQQATYFMMKGVISELPGEQRKKIESLHKKIASIIKEDHEEGVTAMTLLILELTKNLKE
ncbi:hypothetical protein V2154_16620 [Ewingella sp. CoE-038-23]|uniref:hypothetical protein n=1 Tax=Ewingella docleensis TaxID=3118588 RepID=UPI0033656133